MYPDQSSFRIINYLLLFLFLLHFNLTFQLEDQNAYERLKISLFESDNTKHANGFSGKRFSSNEVTDNIYANIL